MLPYTQAGGQASGQGGRVFGRREGGLNIQFWQLNLAVCKCKCFIVFNAILEVECTKTIP